MDLPVRHPLLVKVLFPYLARMYELGFQHAPRWLAHFHNQLVRARESREWLDARHLHREQLLSEALERDPSDAVVRRALIESMARGFAYAVHEVPAGVLYASHGASIAECQELLADLRRFGELVDVHGARATYAEAMRAWEYQFRAYADYVAQRERYTSYAHYLELHGWPGRDAPP